MSGAAWWGLHADLSASVAVVALGYYYYRHGRAGTRPRITIAGGSELAPPEETDSAAEPSLQDTLLERMREVKGLPGQPEPAMAGGILGMLIVTIIRTLFLR